jgi:tetratricopeptide (TPR) repeat protein
MGRRRSVPLTEVYGTLRALIANLMALYHNIPGFDRLYQEFYLGLHPTLTPVQRGRHYELFGRFSQARAYYIDALSSSDLKEDAAFYLGRLLLREREYRKSAQQLERLLRDNPDTKWSAAAHYFSGEAYRALRDVRKAREHYSKANVSYLSANYRLIHLLDGDGARPR